MENSSTENIINGIKDEKQDNFSVMEVRDDDIDGEITDKKSQQSDYDDDIDNKYTKWISPAVKIAVLMAFWAHFLWATYYFVTENYNDFNSTTCSGYGFLTILFILVHIIIIYNVILGPYVMPTCNKLIYTPTVNLLKKIKWGTTIFYLGVLAGALVFLIFDTSEDRQRLIPMSGLSIYLLVGYALSSNRKAIPWPTVFWGLILQFVFGILTIRWDVGRNIFDCAGQKVNTFLGYAVNGSAFVYGETLVYDMQVFAFQALATIYFLGFMINMLYYYGIMQRVVSVLGQFLEYTMSTSVCESVNSAANIFLGMSEAPLLLKPYLKNLTDSEIHSVMTSGFATVSGTVLAAYISFGANPAHLITASVMSAPAALCYSKLMYPETEKVPVTRENIQDVEVEYDSVLDAASKGAHDAFHIVSGIISSLVSFIAFIYFVNGVLSWFGMLVGFEEESEQWTVELIMGKIFIPVSYTMGVPWEDCEKVGQLIGLKTMVNEFAAFQKMKTMVLTEKSKVIATYSICGFSNPGSIGIMISALGTLIPNKRSTITRLVFRAFLGGAIVCFMTACIAAMLIS